MATPKLGRHGHTQQLRFETVALEYLTIRDLGAYIGRSPDTLRRDKGEGKLPPHCDFTKPHRWKRSDIDAWMELKKLGLFGENDWLQLRARLGAIAAWKVMLARLEAAVAETAAVVARELR